MLQAAKEGEVSDEAVDFQIKKGPLGIKLLEQAAGEARCESMYFNILTIFQGFRRHNIAFSESFVHNLRYSSDIYSKDLSGLTQFLEEVVDAEPGMSLEDKGSFLRSLQNEVDADASQSSLVTSYMIKYRIPSDKTLVLCLFKILYHKYIFLDVNSIFNLVQIFLRERLWMSNLYPL